jgi:hypothetical protein
MAVETATELAEATPAAATAAAAFKLAHGRPDGQLKEGLDWFCLAIRRAVARLIDVGEATDGSAPHQPVQVPVSRVRRLADGSSEHLTKRTERPSLVAAAQSNNDDDDDV